MPAPEIIHQLVANFEQNREAYRSGKYNEARLRQALLELEEEWPEFKQFGDQWRTPEEIAELDAKIAAREAREAELKRDNAAPDLSTPTPIL